MLGLKKNKTGYTGWYEPSVAGDWTVEILLPEAERARLKQIKVNGTTQHPALLPPEPILFAGKSQPGKPLRWELLWS